MVVLGYRTPAETLEAYRVEQQEVVAAKRTKEESTGKDRD
jgi:hypothetical protein